MTQTTNINIKPLLEYDNTNNIKYAINFCTKPKTYLVLSTKTLTSLHDCSPASYYAV